MSDYPRLLPKRPLGKTSSPSQIKTFLDCQRKWAWGKINGIYVPPSDSQALGTATHAALEEWLSEGVVPDDNISVPTGKGLRFPGKIASAGLPLLPPPGTCDVEKHFYMEVAEGVVIQGFIDFLTSGPPALVGDHKTTTDFKWAMDEEQLHDDPQGVIYAVAGMLLFNVDAVITRWVYYLNHGTPEARAVQLPRAWEEALAALEPLAAIAITTHELRQTCQSALELPPSPGHCSAYGGCAFIDRCNLSAEERFRSAMGFNIKSFVNQVKQEQQTDVSPVAAAPVPPPVPTQDAAPPPVPDAAPPPVPDAAPPPVPDAAPPPVPESATVAAPPAAFQREDIETWDRAQLKAELARLGVVDVACKWKEKRLRSTLQNVYECGLPKDEQPEPGEEPTVSAPPAPSDPVENTPEVPQEGKTIDVLYIDCMPFPSDGVQNLSVLLASEPSEWRGSIIANTDYLEHVSILPDLEARARLVVRG